MRSRTQLIPWTALALSVSLLPVGCGDRGGPTGGASGGASRPTQPTGQDHKPPTVSTLPKADVVVTAEQLVKDYLANEADADKKYKNKTVQVTGTVASVDTAGSVAGLNFKGQGKSEVQCGVMGDYRDKLKSIKEGQTATLQGQCGGLSKNARTNTPYVSVDGCQVE